MPDIRVLVINPGSTTTKLACFIGGHEASSAQVEHPEDELARFHDIPSQEEYRLGTVDEFMRANGLDRTGIDAIAARGGLMKPVRGGVYRINRRMVDDLRGSRRRWGREHASNLGAVIALALSDRYGVPAFTADPVTVDEMDEVARLSGVPEIRRKSHLHALNVKAMARRAAGEMGAGPGEADFVVAHIGGGITVAAVRRGMIVDVNNALLGMGPFSPTRAGALPIGDLIGLAYGGRYTEPALERKLVKESGLTGYLGTSDVREVERRIEAGDEVAGLVFSAMAYQVSKEIAAMASALHGRVDAVILTGGVSHSRRFTEMVRERVGFIAQVLIYPGEAEMEALAGYAQRALTGEEPVLEYE